jgi:DNA-binding NtrC family response regulator
MTAARILCVDDDSHINELNQIALTRAGYDVETAASPADALERFRAGTFDLVITDLFSTAASDAGFISKLRSMAPSVPIILATGNHNPPSEVLKQTDAFVEKADVLSREKLRRIG